MLQVTQHGPIAHIRLTRTILGRPIYSVAAYLVDGLLVDSGPPHTAGELVRWCRDQGVQQVVNTHHHEDHSGGNGPLHRVLGLPIHAPAASLPTLAHFYRLELYRRIIWGRPEGVQAEALGERLDTPHYAFQVIPTPGHCPEHVCFFEAREGWLFSGDLFIHERAHYLRTDEEMAPLLASLRRVLALEPRTLFCSHAGVVPDASVALARKIAYWEQLQEKALELGRSGLSDRQVARQLLGKEGMMTRVTRGHMSKRNLARALMGPGR